MPGGLRRRSCFHNEGISIFKSAEGPPPAVGLPVDRICDFCLYSVLRDLHSGVCILRDVFCGLYSVKELNVSERTVPKVPNVSERTVPEVLIVHGRTVKAGTVFFSL